MLNFDLRSLLHQDSKNDEERSSSKQRQDLKVVTKEMAIYTTKD